MSDKPARSEIHIGGIVQGVGFRPFVYNLARACRIRGWVNNSPAGVHIDAEGGEGDLDRFIRRLKEEAPPLSVIDTFRTERAEPVGYTDFEIRPSSGGRARDALISADIAVCPDCLRELNDPNDRRYRYPFINCTNCGPRFTITAGIPYDRANTTMRVFPMCPDCAREYHDPADRRFHAQPVACPVCGPSLSLLSADGTPVSPGGEIEKTIELLNAGKIVAVKGLGGYHLACDAVNADAVHELRKRKNRDGKPFALMAKDLCAVSKYCLLNKKETELLQSTARPIVLLDKKPGACPLPDDISSDNNKIGVMLPYTPLHHLLFGGCPELLVMTSGNRSGEPIYYRDAEALDGLRGIADFFLTNNREIYIRTDDSVTSVFRDKEYLIRRSRGYVPRPLDISAVSGDQTRRLPSVLACGGELKNTFCLTKGGKAFLSHHIGDLENVETLESFETGIEHFKSIFSIEPEAVAFDLHPDYLSTRYALRQDGLINVPVQHHRAHIASCMAENGVIGPVIGVAFDGTGYGDDGTIWGGEFFVGDLASFRRAAHFEYLPMPGGETAIREPWRMALSALLHTFGADGLPDGLPFLDKLDPYKRRLVTQQWLKRLNAPLTSSAGRLFDAVSALLGLCPVIEYEGQAAIRLEKCADGPKSTGCDAVSAVYPFDLIPGPDGYEILLRPMIAAVAADLRRGRGVSSISGAFHRTIARVILDTCRRLREESGVRQIALSGGVFQNRLLLELSVSALEADGFRVFIHSAVPTNDGGLSLGQAAIALRKLTEMR